MAQLLNFSRFRCRMIADARRCVGIDATRSAGLTGLLLFLTLGAAPLQASAAEPQGPVVSRLRPTACAAASRPKSIGLLTPPEHVGTTLSAHPTFLWQVTEVSDAPLQFTLMAPGSHDPIYQQTLRADHVGVVAVTLPEDSPDLASSIAGRWPWCAIPIGPPKMSTLAPGSPAWHHRRPWPCS
jgi:Domain of Unknown Function (DUF928)